MLKRVLSITVLFIAFVVLVTNSPRPTPALAQTTNYWWQDSIAIGATVKIDSNYTTITNRWEDVTLWANVNIKVIIGAPDTTDFATRKWLLLNAYQTLSIGPATRLRRIWVISQSDSGALYMAGYKRVPQY
jgi:hypothetical protein